VSQLFPLAKELVKLSHAGEEQDPLTNLRLQNLLYYAQAWSLVIRESELFSEEIRAWRYGPVVPEVYNRLPGGQGANYIEPNSFVNEPDLDAEDAVFVRSVWEAYNQYSAIQLSRMTQKEMPWLKAWGDRPGDGTGNDPISVDDLEDYFGRQAIPAPLAAYGHELRRREEAAARQLLEIPPLEAGLLRAAASSYTTAARRLAGAGG
jgi:uncharacterized phage-associated protein